MKTTPKKILFLFLIFFFAMSWGSPVFSQDTKAEDVMSQNIILDVLDLKDMDVLDVLKLVSKKSGLNIVASKNVKGKVTVYLRDTEVKDALGIIVDAYGWAYSIDNGIVKVMTDKEFEDKYGHAFGHKIETSIKKLQFVPPADLVAMLNQIKSKNGKVIGDEKSGTLVLMDTPNKLIEMEEIISRVDVDVQNKVFDLSYAKVEEISSKISEILTPQVGSLKYDERSNKIIVSDTPRKILEAERIISAFDEKDKEVLIEAKIVQIVLSDEHKFGVDWEAVVSDYHSLNLVSSFDILGSTEKVGKLSIGTLETDEYTAMIEALDTIGTTDILSSPRIMTLNNKEAKILVGSTEPYVTTTTTTTSSGPATTAESVNFIDVGVKLYVTPTIHNDGFITMQIKPEVSTVVENITTSSNNTIPIVETSEAETTISVKDGVTVVIGGLIKEEKITSEKTVPFLGKIPFIKTAFQSRADSITKTEIAIFLSPKIIIGDHSEVE